MNWLENSPWFAVKLSLYLAGALLAGFCNLYLMRLIRGVPLTPFWRASFWEFYKNQRQQKRYKYGTTPMQSRISL